MRGLPSSWVLCEIGNVLIPVEMTGKDEPDHEFWYVDISSIDSQRNRIKEPKRVWMSNAPSRARQKIRSGDVLFSTVRPYLRKIAAVDAKYDREIASTGFSVLRGATGIEPKYLFYKAISHGFVSALTGEQYGVSYPAVKNEQVKAQPIELAPTNEQRRIVEKIEALFDKIDEGVENLRAAKAAIDLYRQSLLKSAFEGSLTTDWRAENADKLESPKALLARIQKERDARCLATLENWQEALTKWRAGGENGKKPAKPKQPREISAKPSDIGISGWTKIPLGLIIDDPTYGTSKKCDYDAGAKGVVRIPNIGSGRIDPTDLKFADFADAELEQYRLIEGDVLTVRSNGSLSIVGKPALVGPQDTNFLFAGYLIRLRPIAASLVPKFLVYLMIEPSVRRQIEVKAKSTSGVNNVSAKEIQELHVPICSTAEQTEIVRILVVGFVAADELEAEIDAVLSRADILRQSILNSAFSGKLVPQDPKDEPATKLLDRIQDMCAKAPATTKRKDEA